MPMQILRGREKCNGPTLCLGVSRCPALEELTPTLDDWQHNHRGGSFPPFKRGEWQLGRLVLGCGSGSEGERESGLEVRLRLGKENVYSCLKLYPSLCT